MTQTWSVGGLLNRVNEVLTEVFDSDLWVEGEIANLSRSPNGHVYFTLLDTGSGEDTPPAGGRRSAIKVVLFEWYRRTVNLQLTRVHGSVRMTDGVRVRIKGRVEVYAGRGELSLRMVAVDPTFTLGLLVTERDRVLAALAADGVMRKNGSRQLSPLPVRVALISSLAGDGAADFRHELESSGFAFEILTLDTRVQGTDAELSVVAALRTAGRLGVDVISLVRGGGARTDLAAFDSDGIARAIVDAPVPVFTGIGHELDRSVADEVAHTAFKTPTACAAAIVSRVREARTALELRWSETAEAARSALDQQTHRLDRLAARAGGAANSDLTTAAARVKALEGRLVRSATLSTARADTRLSLTEARLSAHDPYRLMRQGWALIRDAQDRVVVHLADLHPGDRVTLQLAGGRAGAVIGELTPTSTGPDPRTDDGPDTHHNLEL